MDLNLDRILFLEMDAEFVDYLSNTENDFVDAVIGKDIEDPKYAITENDEEE